MGRWIEKEINWKWLQRHKALPSSKTWADTVKATKSGPPSRFVRNLPFEAIKTAFLRKRRYITQSHNEQYFYVILDFEAGVSLGEMTNIIKVHWLDFGDVHAYPITPEELLADLDCNEAELGYVSKVLFYDVAISATLRVVSFSAKEGMEMARLLLTDDEWECIKGFFEERAPTGRPPVDRRRVLNGIFWILRTGSPWRDLPEEFGKWQTVWRLFDQWNGDGTLDAVLECLRAAQIDVGAISQELWCVDGTVVRAARCSAGGGKKGTRRNHPITL